MKGKKMVITLFGYIWIAIFLYIVIRDDRKLCIKFLLVGMILQSSSVIVLNGVGIGPQVLTSIFFLIYYIVNELIISDKLVVRLNTKNHIGALMILLFLLTVLISYIYNRSSYINNNNVVLLIVQLWLYGSCSIILLTGTSWMTRKEMYDCIVFVIRVILILGALQIAATSGLYPRKYFWTMLGYIDSPYAYYDDNFTFFRVTSTFYEPSYLAVFLVGSFFFIMSVAENDSKKYRLIVAMLIEIILTFSTTAYVAMCFGAIAYLIKGRNKKIIWYIVPCLVLIMIIAFIRGNLGTVLNDVIFNKTSGGSFRKRSELDRFALEIFRNSKVLGAGYKSVRASSILNSMLAQIGLTGFICWTLYNAIFIKTALFGDVDNYCIGSGLMLLTALISMLIAVPDIDTCGYWTCIYICCYYLNDDALLNNQYQ